MNKIFKINSYDIDLKPSEKKFALECLKYNQIATGRFKEKFENSIKKLIRSKYAVACSNGSSALFLSMKLSGVKKDTEVIVPSFTFIATVNAIKLNNANPIFMDVDNFHNIDQLKTIEFLKKNTFTRNNKTYNSKTNKHISAIIIVHMWGRPADFSKLFIIAKKMNIKIVEDAAEALGSKYTSGKFKDKYVGTIGDFGCLSFNANKIITCGGGGMILTNKKQMETKINHIITQAKKDKIFFVHDQIGYNLNLSNIQCAIGYGQSLNFKKILKRKEKVYNFYLKNFKKKTHLSFLEEPSYAISNKWFNILSIKKSNKKNLIKKVNSLRRNKIDVRGVWYPIDLQIMYRKCQKFKIKKTYEIANNSICLPSGPNLTIEQQKKIINIL